MNWFAELKALLAMIMLMAIFVILVVYEYDVPLVWAVVAAIAGLGGFEIFRYINGKKQ